MPGSSRQGRDAKGAQPGARGYGRIAPAAAARLLVPGLVALLGIIHHLPEWLKTRAAWYIQTFNICNWTLAMLAAWACFHGFSHDNRVSYALAGAAAAIAIAVAVMSRALDA